MGYAVIQIGQKQYKVRQGDTVEVERIPSQNGSIVFDKVLLLVEEGTVTVGTPTVKHKKVIGQVVAQTQGQKIRVSRFTSKVRYRKSKGFRPKTTKIKIESVNGADKNKTEV